MILSLNVQNWPDKQEFYDSLLVVGKKPSFSENRDIVYWVVEEDDR